MRVSPRARWRALAVSVLVVLGCACPAGAALAASGGWTIVPSPSPGSTEDSRLSSVACTSAASCWAVGQYFDGTSYRTLVERYNGAAWRIVGSPNAPGSGDNYLNAVSCLPDKACWAAGYWIDGSGAFHTLIETRTAGGGWSLQASPDTAETIPGRPSDDVLSGLSCVTASECWAVGFAQTPGTVEPLLTPGIPPQTLIERYDGSSWQIASSPDQNSSENELNAVSCTGAGNCWAVGVFLAGSPTGPSSYQTLVERYSGSSWQISSSPNAGSAELNELDGVSCADATSCTAVGIYSPNGGPNQTLVERYGGSNWQIERSANAATDRLNALTSVSCSSSDNCWAVGEHDANGNFLFQTLIEQGTASGWVIVPSPDTSPRRSNQLQSIACPAPQQCFAVGFYSGASANQPLVEEYSGPPAASVPELSWPGAAALVATIPAAVLVRRRRRGIAGSPD
ncbi:MAG: hypothetical protein ACYCO3_01515 [Mycobacteriales bacterium]